MRMREFRNSWKKARPHTSTLGLDNVKAKGHDNIPSLIGL